MDKKNISISICVPAFNEEQSLRTAVEDLLKTLSTRISQFEIIIVNDGSTDATARLAEQIVREYPLVKVIHHGKNLGIGFCYRNALAMAQGAYFTWFPSDHENSAEQFVASLPYLAQDTIVTFNHLEYDQRPFLRKKLSRVYTWLINRCFGLHLKYYNDLTIFPTSVLRSFSLTTSGFVFSAEGLIKAVQCGCRVVELSVPLRKRGGGRSKAFGLPEMIRMGKDFLRLLAIRKRRPLVAEKLKF